jgi:hypothetical protein
MPDPNKRKPRSYRQSFLLAVIAVYLPAILPLLGPLTENGNGLEQYLKLLVIGPGVAVGIFIPYADGTIVMGIVTALLLLFMTLAARTLRGLELAIIYSPTIALLGMLYYALGNMML